jgi:hypothetical protein
MTIAWDAGLDHHKWRSCWQQMGIAPLEVTQDAIIREGKIHFFNTSFTPASAARFQAARKKH